MKRHEVYALISAERDRQNAKWKRQEEVWDDHPGVKLAVLTEEIGEVAKALLEAPNADPERDNEGLRKELVQVGAVCVAWLQALLEAAPMYPAHCACGGTFADGRFLHGDNCKANTPPTSTSPPCDSCHQPRGVFIDKRGFQRCRFCGYPGQ